MSAVNFWQRALTKIWSRDSAWPPALWRRSTVAHRPNKQKTDSKWHRRTRGQKARAKQHVVIGNVRRLSWTLRT